MLARWKLDLALAFSLCAGIVVLSGLPLTRELDRRVSDAYFRLQPSHRNSNVVVVAIDDASLNKFGRWPWNRATLARLMASVAAQRPKVIGVDVLFSEPQDTGNDAALNESIRNAGNVVLVDKIAAFPEGPRWVEPLPAFAASAIAVGHAQAVLDSDGICRRFPPEQLSLSGMRYAFAVEVARRASRVRTREFLTGYGLRAEADSNRIVMAHPVLIPIAFSSAPITTVSAAELLSPDPPTLHGKVVLVGFGPSELGDRITTPVSRQSPTPGVEVHAQIVQAILESRTLHPISAWSLAVVAFLQSLAALSLFQRWRGWMTVPTIATICAAVLGAGWSAFCFAGKLIPAASLLCGVLVTPVLLYSVELAAVEKSVSRQMLLLARWFYHEEESRSPRDLTWRMTLLTRLQEELEQRFELFHTLLETTSDLVAVFEAGGKLLFQNHAFGAAWGLRAPSTMADLRSRIVESKDAPLVRSQGGIEGEAHLGGTLFALRFVPLPCTAMVPKGGTLLTMTNLKLREERDHAREEALHFITHELRTPISAIQNFAELMMLYPHSSTSAKAPETILRESDRLLLLINSYLDVLRSDAGARPIRVTRMVLRRMLDRVIEIVTPLAQAHGIQVCVRCEEMLSISGDETLLSGAVLNLLSNAIKYGSRESEILVCATEMDGELELQVTNSGSTIPGEDVGRMFVPFVRSAEAESSQPGTGLGLSIVKRIAEKHRGTIAAESPGPGQITFTLRLPVDEAAAGVAL